MRVAFISGKYRAATPGGLVANIRAAEECARELWAMGYSTITPHLNSALFDGVTDAAAFLAGYLEMVRRMDPARDVMVMLKGWEESAGARDEFCLAAEMGLHVEFWPQNRLPIADLIERDSRRDRTADNTGNAAAD